MAIHVKSHRRGKSVVRAYSRLGKAIKAVEKRAYGKKSASAGRQKQYHMTLRKLENKQIKVRDVLGAKFSTGGALLRGKRSASSFAMSNLARKYR